MSPGWIGPAITRSSWQYAPAVAHVAQVDAYRRPLQRLALLRTRQLGGRFSEQVEERLPHQDFQEIGGKKGTRAVEAGAAVEPPARRQQRRLHRDVAQAAPHQVP